MTIEQILAMLDTISAQLHDIGERIERLGESIADPIHSRTQGEEIIEVHTATGTQYFRASDMTPTGDITLVPGGFTANIKLDDLAK